MPSQYYFPQFNSNVTFSMFDVLFDADGRYYYSTKDGNLGHSPREAFLFNAVNCSRSDDIATLTYTATGGAPTFVRGSIIRIADMTDGTFDFTGMALDGSPGSVSYVNPGWSQSSSSALPASISCTISPNWTTGFFFVPTYSTKAQNENKPIVAQLGDLYTQRQPQGINTNNQTLNLIYQSRDKREMRAIVNYIEVAAGAYPFEILLADPFLNNQPNLKYAGTTVDATPVSFGRYDIQAVVYRVYDLA